MQQEINSLSNPSSSPASTSSQISLSHHHPMQNPSHHFHDPTSSSSSEDFLEQMLFTMQSSPWGDLTDAAPPSHPPPLNDSPNILNNHSVNPDGVLGLGFSGFDVSVLLASKLQQHQISGGSVGRVPPNSTLLDGSQFKSLPAGCDESMQGLHNVFAASSQHPFFHSQPQNLELLNQQQPSPPQPQPHPLPQPQPQASGSSSGGTAPAQQPKPRVRARRGQATDPHSIAERLRRERIAERMKSLQELVPNANKTDKASMLDEIIDYVKFLQLQVKVLSMSRLGGAAAVAPLVTDMSSEGAAVVGDCCPPNGSNGRSTSQTPSPGENITVTEHHVAKLMEEDMGSAMQFLQGKGLCLMPISLATAISTATCQNRTSPLGIGGNGRQHRPSDGEASLRAVQSASVGIADGSSKDAASISKP